MGAGRARLIGWEQKSGVYWAAVKERFSSAVLSSDVSFPAPEPLKDIISPWWKTQYDYMVRVKHRTRRGSTVVRKWVKVAG